MGDLDAVLRVVRGLNERPEWKWPKEHRDDLRGERALPLLCVVGEPDRTDVVADALTARLNPDPAKFDLTPARLIPSASVDAGRVDPDADEQGRPVLPLLNQLVHHLCLDRYGAGREIPFHTFRLVDWLTRHTASTLGRDQQAPLRSKLLEWYAPVAQEGEDQLAPIVEAVVPDKALALSKAMPRLLSRFGRWLWLRGFRGGEPRWLMRQRFAGTRHSASFLRFARRLTVDHRKHENLDQIKLLLVHAFLRDLRLFYGTRTWWLRRWRRTAYLTVVLRGITEHNGGWELLRLVNDVRNQTGEHDPLLVVATAADLPDDLELAPAPVGEIDAAVAAWKRELPWKRQQFRPTARFVAVRLDNALDPAPHNDCEHWAPRKVPLFARRWMVVTTVLALLAGGGSAVLTTWPADPCDAARFPLARVTWLPDTHECIGYSAGGYVFGGTKKLKKAQKAVFEQNARAAEINHDNPRRSIISLVYFAELTHPKTQEGTDDAEAEEMTGLLIQQSRYNQVDNSTEDTFKPLLRIVVVSGGYQMRHARRAVDDFIAPLAEEDPALVGVVGGSRTVAQTESAIGALGAHGIPILATTLTGHTLPEVSPLYFQMVAGNDPQARLITGYAASEGRSVTVYHPDLEQEPDQYLRSLHRQFKRLAREHPPVRFRPWRTPATVEITCHPNDIAFYAGRETGFADFLDHVLTTCQTAAKPTVIGDDAITRFIAQGESRQSDSFAGISIGYVSLANRIVLAGSSCVSHGRPAHGGNPRDEQPLKVFCKGLHRLYRPTTEPPAWREFGAELAADHGRSRWTGERVGIAYDAADLFVTAAIHNAHRRLPDAGAPGPNRAAVAHELRELDCVTPENQYCFKGVSGRIDFRAGRDGSNRPLAILTVQDINAINPDPTCTYRVQDSAPCP